MSIFYPKLFCFDVSYFCFYILQILLEVYSYLVEMQEFKFDAVFMSDIVIENHKFIIMEKIVSFFCLIKHWVLTITIHSVTILTCFFVIGLVGIWILQLTTPRNSAVVLSVYSILVSVLSWFLYRVLVGKLDKNSFLKKL